MQPNTLTFVVDVLNNGTTEEKVYTRFEEFQNRAAYIGSTHSPASRDMLALYRSFPTRNGNFRGTSKSSVKFTRDISVPGVDGNSVIVPMIIELSFSIPVGAAEADVKEYRQTALAILDDDEVMTPLNMQLMV